MVKIAKTLPSDTSILSDLVKVIFIGSGVPSKQAIKKVFTVRREKVYNALSYLVQNHPLYSVVEICESIQLPDDDIPEEIWKIMTLHEDEENEDEKEHANYTLQTEISEPTQTMTTS